MRSSDDWLAYSLRVRAYPIAVQLVCIGLAAAISKNAEDAIDTLGQQLCEVPVKRDNSHIKCNYIRVWIVELVKDRYHQKRVRMVRSIHFFISFEKQRVKVFMIFFRHCGSWDDAKVINFRKNGLCSPMEFSNVSKVVSSNINVYWNLAYLGLPLKHWTALCSVEAVRWRPWS